MENLVITNVRHLGGFILLCTFSSGITKQVDMTPLLAYPAYEDLRDEEKFKQFGLDETIFWSNGADIAPEWIFNNGIEV
ncbi:MAG: DUF2442 domain-containing protein [Muribaculaceae bacterium]|nr:DUF2442 domain-containing protein [Muribaculaceae bacterium]MDE7334706.1 DUF2442 domain-containing protein [Muribaculaceae bacterium]